MQVDVLDSGCCGMAGSFGFEPEHYEASLRIGEKVLLPAVRNAAADTRSSSAASVAASRCTKARSGARCTWLKCCATQ